MRRTLTSLSATLLVGGIIVGCASKGGGSTPPPPGPTVNSVAPYYGVTSPLNLNYAIAGQGGFTLLVNGNDFTNSSVVEWNGNTLPTQFGDATDLAATVSNSLIASSGAASITVKDTASGAASNTITFQIASPATATAGVVALVTAAPDGTPANGDSLVAPSISANGRYVAFQSNATNLAPGPASGYQEIYERDTCTAVPSGCTPSTFRISVTYDGSPVMFHSRSSAISADGRYVAFDSQATNILPGTAVCGPPLGSCVFLRDTCINAPPGCVAATFPISANMKNQMSTGSLPSISPDGRFVAFQSSASDLVAGATGVQVYLRDTCIGTASSCTPSTSLVSTATSGSAGNQNSGSAEAASLGEEVVFFSSATDIVPGESVLPGIFLRSTCVGAPPGCSPGSVRLDVGQNDMQANQPVFTGALPAISADGRFVAFGSAATNLVANTSCAQSSGCGNVYMRDACLHAAGCTPSTSILSLANDGSVPNCFQGGSPGNQSNVSMNASGRLISFGSISTNLTPDDMLPACGGEDIFVHDTCLNAPVGCVPSLVRVSVANTPNPGTSGNAISTSNEMSADGHYVVFISSATNFLPGVAGNGHAMVYIAKTGF